MVCRRAVIGGKRAADGLRLVLAAPPSFDAGADEGPVEVVPDVAGKAFGRGAWIHVGCFGPNVFKGLSRGFKRQVRGSLPELAARLEATSERRIEGLLLAARRSGCLAVGTDAVSEAVRRGAERGPDGARSRVLVAEDARAAATSAGVREAERLGMCLSWGSKAGIGTVLGRDEVAVVAVLDAGLAEALARMVALVRVARVRQQAPAGTARGRQTETRASNPPSDRATAGHPRPARVASDPVTPGGPERGADQDDEGRKDSRDPAPQAHGVSAED